MIIDDIKRDFGACVVKKCRGESSKCYICANVKVPNVALDCDELKNHGKFTDTGAKDGKSSDCVLMECDGVLYVGVLEFKGAGYNESEVIEQLLAGSQIADWLLRRYNVRKNFEMWLIVVACRHDESARRVFYRRLRLSGGVRRQVIMAKCGDTFKNIRERKRDF